MTGQNTYTLYIKANQDRDDLKYDSMHYVLKSIIVLNNKYGWRSFNVGAYGSHHKYKYGDVMNLEGPSDTQVEFLSNLNKKLESMKKKGYILAYELMKTINQQGVPERI